MHDTNTEMIPEFVSEWRPKLGAVKIPMLLLIQGRGRRNPITATELGERLDLTWEEVWAVIELLERP